jgi:hypothetical protein
MIESASKIIEKPNWTVTGLKGLLALLQDKKLTCKPEDILDVLSVVNEVLVHRNLTVLTSSGLLI